MRKIFTAATTAAVAGAMALGLAAAPASATSANAQTAAAPATATANQGWKFKIVSPLGEGYMLGRFQQTASYTILRSKIVDTTNGPRDYTYAEVSYIGHVTGKRRFHRTKTLDNKKLNLTVRFIKDLDVRLCEGNAHEYQCTRWIDVY